MDGIELIVGRNSQGEGSLLINRNTEGLGSGESLIELGGLELVLRAQGVLEVSEGFGSRFNLAHSSLNKLRSGFGSESLSTADKKTSNN